MDLQKQKDERPDLEKRLTTLEKKSRIAELLLDIKDHGGIKLLLEGLEEIVNGINAELLSSKRLETEDREKLLVDKDRCLYIIGIFPQAEVTLKNINNYIGKL